MWVAFYNYRDTEFTEQGEVWLNLNHVVALQQFEPDTVGEPNYSVYLSNGNKYRLSREDFVALAGKLEEGGR